MTAIRPDDGRRWIAFVVYPGVRPLDLVGPLTVLRDLRVRTPFRSAVVAAQAAWTTTDSDLALVPSVTFDELPMPWAVVVPGSGATIARAMRDPALVAYVRRVAASAELVASIGTGSVVLAEAGLLEGRRIADPGAAGELLRRRGAIPVAERWVRDGRTLTAAGGTAGIDAFLALVTELVGPSRALLAQLAMEYDPRPPFGPDRGPVESIGGTIHVG